MTRAYYNELEPYAAQWLRNLIAAGHIAPGDVDERDIRTVKPTDLVGYTQCHFFAGIGAWSHALRFAGVGDSTPVWTGSCPCQPFSSAGKRRGTADERHLWPAWFALIRECRPERIFAEQVSSRDALAWLDAVCSDLESAGYAVGAIDLPACGIGAPHIRNRLYFVAHRNKSACGQGREDRSGRTGRDSAQPRAGSGGGGGADWVGEPAGAGRQRAEDGDHGAEPASTNGASPGQCDVPGPCNGFWRDAIWIPCRDGKARPAKPGIHPLAYGATARVGRLRAYGNAICAPLAAEFIKATKEKHMKMSPVNHCETCSHDKACHRV